MKIKVVRKYFLSDSTAGKLYINGKFFCYTLEDEIRQVKVKGETAIPYGSYEVLLTQSPKFGKVVPLINNVPGFSGIRIHPGNTSADTEGCLLVGDTLSDDRIRIGESKNAYDRLFAVLNSAVQAGEKIEIEFTYEEIEAGKIFFFIVVAVIVLAVAYYLLTQSKRQPAFNFS